MIHHRQRDVEFPVHAGRHKGPGGPTRDQLYEEAKKKNIERRSHMNKEQLRRAVGR